MPARTASPKDTSRTLEGESDLRQFLKVACPHWLCARPGGGNDISRVIEKLRAVGIYDVAGLVKRVTSNTINDNLTEAGYSRFSKDTIDCIRKQGQFIRTMEALTESNFRRTGAFAPVPQMLSKRSLGQQELRKLKRSPDTVNNSKDPKRLGSGVADGSGSSRSAALAILIPDITAAHPSVQLMAEEMPEAPSPTRSVGLRGGRKTWAMSTSVSLPALAASTPASSRFSAMASPTSAPKSADSASRGMPWPTAASLPLPHHGQGSAPVSPADSRRLRASASLHAMIVQTAQVGLPAGDQSEGNSPAARSSASSKWERIDQQIERIQQEGTRMANGQNQPAWTVLKRKNDAVVEQAEAMLIEQQELDERAKLYRSIQLEGQVSPLRKHIAKNIRSHLNEVSGSDAKDAMDVQHRCTNIRKHLASMVNARRELNMIRRNVPNIAASSVHSARSKSSVK